MSKKWTCENCGRINYYTDDENCMHCGLIGPEAFEKKQPKPKKRGGVYKHRPINPMFLARGPIKI